MSCCGRHGARGKVRAARGREDRTPGVRASGSESQSGRVVELELRRRKMCTLATRWLLLLTVTSHAIGCATISCDSEARETAPKKDERALATDKAKCERRVADMRRSLQKQEEERDEQERRDAFRNRNDAQPR